MDSENILAAFIKFHLLKSISIYIIKRKEIYLSNSKCMPLKLSNEVL
jgi:hypothetical protein